LAVFPLLTMEGPVPVAVFVTVTVPRAFARPPVKAGLSTPAKLPWALMAMDPPTVPPELGPMLLVPVPVPPETEFPDTVPDGPTMIALPKLLPLIVPVLVRVPSPADPPLAELPMKEEPPRSIPV
jgi:hypothetical protein